MQISYTPNFQGKLPRQVLEKYIAEKIPISDIAKRENLSLPYISKRFKAEGLKPVNKHTLKKQNFNRLNKNNAFKRIKPAFYRRFSRMP